VGPGCNVVPSRASDTSQAKASRSVYRRQAMKPYSRSREAVFLDLERCRQHIGKMTRLGRPCEGAELVLQRLADHLAGRATLP
jgi:hypothetical protein